MKHRSKVYIINKAAHDFSAAKKYGKLVYLSQKPISRYATNNIFRLFYPILKKSGPEDYVLITSLNTMNIIACVIMALMHHKIKLLIHFSEDNSYIERILSFETVMEDLNGKS